MKSIGVATGLLLLLTATSGAPVAAQTAGEQVAAVTSTTSADERTGTLTSVERLRPGPASDLLGTHRRLGAELSASLAATSEPRAPTAVVLQQDRRKGLTWLIVGGSMLAAGLLIDGDAGTALSVGGALVGGYGVYLLVRD